MGDLSNTQITFDTRHEREQQKAVQELNLVGATLWQNGRIVIVRGDIQKDQSLGHVITNHIAPFAQVISPKNMRI